MPFSRCSTSCSDHAFFATYIVHIGWGNSNQKCICGNTPPIEAKKVLDSECTQNCPGDSSHKCGGARNHLERGKMNIYKVHLQGNSCAEVLIILIYPRQTELMVVDRDCTVNLTGETFVTGKIRKFHRCHRWWAVKLVVLSRHPHYSGSASKYGQNGWMMKICQNFN